jgi:hypothetical protein
MYAKNLHDLLENAVNQARSLELFFRGTVNQQLVSGNMLVNSGSIFQFSLERYSGRTALKLLPRVDLVMALGVPLEKKLTNKDEDTPEAEEVLLTLKSMMLKQSGAIVAKASGVLLTKVEIIVQEVLGSGANSQLARIAQQFPPDEKPVEFLDQCENLIAPMVGQKAAKQMFAPLYSSV